MQKELQYNLTSQGIKCICEMGNIVAGTQDLRKPAWPPYPPHQ